MTKQFRPSDLATLVVHAGEERDGGGLVPPIHRSSTYELGEPETFDDIRYIRLNNTPTQKAVERKLGALEEGTALVTPSGTAAVWLAIAASVGPGDRILAPVRVYGGTRKILDHLAEREGVEVRYVDLEKPDTWAEALSETTRAFYMESIANPWMSVPPLDQVVAFCREHGLVSLVDNTLATPALFRPRPFGIDISIHSASKHLNGHTDVVLGAVIADAERGLAIRKLANKLGVCPDPEPCFLLNRGMKTLPLRVSAQCAGALALAQALDAHADVETVHYAGLEADPSHGRAAAWFGGFGTMLSFVPSGGKERAQALIRALRYPVEAPSLGGVETLICRTATTSHAGLPAELREEMGVPDAMIRVSVGVERPEDLIADFEQALKASASMSAA